MTLLSWTAVWHALLFGAICAAGYDPLVACRRVFRLPVWLVTVLDLCYFFVLSSVVYSFFLVESYGTVRVVLVICGGIGALVWYQTLGRLFRILWKVPFWILKVVLMPLGSIGRLLWVPFRKLGKIMDRGIKKLRRNVENLLAKHRTRSV